MKSIVSSTMMLSSKESTTSSNLGKVSELFEKFGAGDALGILEMVAEDCEWHHGGDAELVPFAVPYHGKAGVLDFLQTIGANISVKRMEPSNFQEQGNIVSHDFLVEAMVIPTGKPYLVNVLYEWTFNEAGEICKYRSTGDFSMAEAAFKP